MSFRIAAIEPAGKHSGDQFAGEPWTTDQHRDVSGKKNRLLRVKSSKLQFVFASCANDILSDCGKG